MSVGLPANGTSKSSAAINLHWTRNPLSVYINLFNLGAEYEDTSHIPFHHRHNKCLLYQKFGIPLANSDSLSNSLLKGQSYELLIFYCTFIIVVGSNEPVMLQQQECHCSGLYLKHRTQHKVWNF